MKHKKKIQFTALGLVIISLILSGTNAVALKFATNSIEPLVYAGIRALSVSAILLVFVGNYRKIFSRKIILRVLPGAFLLFMFLSLSATAIGQSGALKASVLSLTFPVFVYLYALVLLHEPLIKKIFIGGLITLSGSLLLIGAPALLGQPLLISDVMLLLGYASYAGVIIHAKYMFKWLTPNELLSIRFFISGLLLVAFALITSGPASFIVGDGSAWLTLIYSILFVGIISNTLYYRGLSRVKAEQTAPLLYLDPMTSALLAAVVLGESLDATAIIGATVILIGVVLSYPHHHHLLHHYMHPKTPLLKRLLNKLLNKTSLQ